MRWVCVLNLILRYNAKHRVGRFSVLVRFWAILGDGILRYFALRQKERKDAESQRGKDASKDWKEGRGEVIDWQKTRPPNAGRGSTCLKRVHQ